jgi:hypothetical protein
LEKIQPVIKTGAKKEQQESLRKSGKVNIGYQDENKVDPMLDVTQVKVTPN